MWQKEVVLMGSICNLCTERYIGNIFEKVSGPIWEIEKMESWYIA